MLFLSNTYIEKDYNQKIAYKLISVLLHNGDLEQGHYTALALHKNAEGADIWYYLNDSGVQEVTSKDVVNKQNAYMLFYSKI